MIKTHAVTSDKKTPGLDPKDLAKRIAQMKRSYVTIGIHSDAGQYGDTGVEVYEVALWNEFGTPNAAHPIPERSFFRSALNENEGVLNELREQLIQDITEGKVTVKKALEKVGFRVKTLIENKIKSNVPPENAESTKNAKIAAGYGTNTLIASGLLLRSVTYKVEMK